MADLLMMGSAACERSGQLESDGPCGACHSGSESGSLGSPAGRTQFALPGSATALDWQLPLPPVRFPLREAMMALQQEDPREASAEASALAQRGPLKVFHTEKSRALRTVGHQRRHGNLTQWSTTSLEEAPQPIPKAPPEADQPSPAPKSNPSKGTLMRRQQRKGAEQVGLASWPIMGESRSAPNLAGEASEVPHTWSSAARAVLGHSKRFPGSGEHAAVTSPTMGSQWAGSTLQSYRHLPRPVKEWADTGMGFTDKGLGIGDRFDLEVTMRARRSPGAVYEQGNYGNVALWSPNQSQPTKQACSQHTSTEVHRMGARRRENKLVDRQQPCPGSYEVLGFAEENQRRAARGRGKGGVPSSSASTGERSNPSSPTPKR